MRVRARARARTNKFVVGVPEGLVDAAVDVVVQLGADMDDVSLDFGSDDEGGGGGWGGSCAARWG